MSPLALWLPLIVSLAPDAGPPAACMSESGDLLLRRASLQVDDAPPAVRSWWQKTSQQVDRPQLAGCHGRRMDQDITLEGRTRLVFVVAPDGSVSNAAADF